MRKSRTIGETGKVAAVLAVSLVAGTALSAPVLAQTPGAAPAAAVDEDDYGLNPSWSDRLSDSMKAGISRATSAVGIGKPAGPPPPENPSGCPSIAILDGTEAQRVMAPGATDNQGLRYQYSLLNVGRECTLSGGRMTVKVGAGGRVLLGPAGSAGHFDVPIRIVVLSEINGKPVESKLFKVSTSIGAGQGATPFQFVSDTISVPIAAGRNGLDYSIKVGIDTGKNGANVQGDKPGRHRKKKDVATATQ